MKQIKFTSKAEEKKGYAVLLYAGTIVYTNEAGKYIVPEESIKKLKRKKIKFQFEPIQNNSHRTS